MILLKGYDWRVQLTVDARVEKNNDCKLSYHNFNQIMYCHYGGLVVTVHAGDNFLEIISLVYCTYCTMGDNFVSLLNYCHFVIYECLVPSNTFAMDVVYHSKFNACKFRNCEIIFISLSYDCLYPKATYCALSSTVYPDLCISYGISDEDLTNNYISIVMHVCHYMILHIVID